MVPFDLNLGLCPASAMYSSSASTARSHYELRSWAVIKTENFIRARVLHHREFVALLQEV